MRLANWIPKGLGVVIAMIASRLIVDSAPRVYRFLFKRWPELRGRVPEDLSYYDRARLTVLASDAEVPLWKWVYTRGGSRFLHSEVPDPFFACVIQSRGNLEYLIVLWRVGNRRFWFCDEYVVYMGDESTKGLVARSSRRLKEALGRWDSGCTAVVFTGEYGWYDSRADRWEADARIRDAARRDAAEDDLRANLGAQWEEDKGSGANEHGEA